MNNNISYSQSITNGSSKEVHEAENGLKQKIKHKIVKTIAGSFECFDTLNHKYAQFIAEIRH